MSDRSEIESAYALNLRNRERYCIVAARAQHQPFNQALGRRQGATTASARNPRGRRSSVAGAGRRALQTTAGGSSEAYSMSDLTQLAADMRHHSSAMATRSGAADSRAPSVQHTCRI